MSIHKTTHMEPHQGHNGFRCVEIKNEQTQNIQNQKHLCPLLRRRNRRFFCSSLRAGSHCRIGQKKQLTLWFCAKACFNPLVKSKTSAGDCAPMPCSRHLDHEPQQILPSRQIKCPNRPCGFHHGGSTRRRDPRSQHDHFRAHKCAEKLPMRG